MARYLAMNYPPLTHEHGRRMVEDIWYHQTVSTILANVTNKVHLHIESNLLLINNDFLDYIYISSTTASILWAFLIKLILNNDPSVSKQNYISVNLAYISLTISCSLICFHLLWFCSFLGHNSKTTVLLVFTSTTVQPEPE